MKVRLIARNVWRELHGQEVEVISANCKSGSIFTTVDVAVDGKALTPPLDEDCLRGVVLWERESDIGARADGVIAIGSVFQAWEEFLPEKFLEGDMHG